MGKMSNQEKLKYTRLVREDILPEDADKTCFYCDGPASMDDVTPSKEASEQDKAEFQEPWTITRTCSRCWKKIYTENVVGGAFKYGRRFGMMTVEDKTKATGLRIKSAHVADVAKVANRAFVMSETGIVCPAKAIRVGSSYQVDSDSFTEFEMIALQGPLALALLARDESIIEVALGMVLQQLDPERSDVYRKIVGLSPTEIVTSGNGGNW